MSNSYFFDWFRENKTKNTIFAKGINKVKNFKINCKLYVLTIYENRIIKERLK